ncbi:NEL-type E3 ubiquitin ligase domain-containing protein [Pseudomonas sp. NPDC089534]|uniref:NEL-type E3 ubiquitin ligase domain-containing protein n=1 Tax=Pseudomonas sp. NPDC089534 TaxID=3364468 RepID=UPI00381FA3DA
MSETKSYSGQHYELIKKRIDPVFSGMALHRSQALRNITPERAAWMSPKSPHIQRSLAGSNVEAWSAQNSVDKMLSGLKDARSFGEKLLKEKLWEQYRIDVDARNTYLRLYTAATHGGFRSRTISLLDAALQNFASHETFAQGSDFLIRTDPARELYDVSPLGKAITLDQFKAVCRELDIGSRYMTHLKEVLLNREPVAYTYLKNGVQKSQKAALKAAAQMALATREITRDAHLLIRGLLADRSALELNGQPMQVFELSLLGTRLTGILVIAPKPSEQQVPQALIAYVPHDPRHPLKQYPDGLAFIEELIWQLREDKTLASNGHSYQQYFSQFVDHEQRGHFLAGLEQYLAPLKFYGQEPNAPRPAWREGPPDLRALRFGLLPVTQPVWEYLYRRQIDKILNDARVIAVSTADADSNARWAWWDNIGKIALTILNVAVMVAAPFVPVLGELMLAYTAYQLTSDVIESVVDLAEDIWREGAEHIVGVVGDVVQLGAMAAGIPIARAFKLKLSAMVDNMIPVSLPNGETRLWHPDIQPYEHRDLVLPRDLTPDAQGLYHHGGAQVLRLENRHLKVKWDPQSGQYRVEHPSRPDAYAPTLKHNGHGAWRHEGEDPLTWDSAALMRRLGHNTDGLTAQQLEDIRRISATDVEALQRMHADGAPPPLLLADTLKRFKAFEDVGLMKRQIRSGAALDPSALWFAQMVTEMPGWPSGCALKVYRNPALEGEFHLYGNAGARPQQTLSIGLAQVMEGKLPEAVSRFLNDAQLQGLLGSAVPATDRVQTLRDRLAQMIAPRAQRIADYTYGFREQSRDLHVQRLRHRYPDLPVAVAERLIAGAPPAALDALGSEGRLPLDFKVQARECAFEVRLSRAYEGFYKESPLPVDTERLALNTVMGNKALKDVRIEIRDDHPDNPLRCAAGAEDARHRRVLLRDDQGRYAVLDGDRSPLFDARTLYEALLQAMPKGSPSGLQPGQGPYLRKWLMDKTALPEERRKALLTAPFRPVAAEETHWMLRIWSWFRRPTRALTPLEQRVRNLYPRLTDAERDTFIRSLPAGADPMAVVKGLEVQLSTLESLLDNWREKMAPSLPDEPSIPPRDVKDIADKLMACFRRESRVFKERNVRFDSGYSLDLSADTFGFNLEKWWKRLPDIKEYLDQVGVLNLDNLRFSERSGGLLKDFPRLRRFSARNCGLTQVPEAVYAMRELQVLRLSDNAIALTDRAVEQLGFLTRLQTLRLDRNPLLKAPDVTNMRHLTTLSLRDSSITDWPAGLLKGHRPRGLFTDLSGNQLLTVPQVTPGSPQAWIVARARISVSRLSADLRERLFEYRDAAGRPRQITIAALADDALAKWPLESDSLMWNADSNDLGAYREEAWHNLMNEPNSTGFFRIIDSLTQSADFIAGGETRTRLSRRVWDLIDAMDLDTPLREQLFETAENPTTCADASSEVFNTMGVQALASQAYSYSTSAEELERKLVTLAKGAARLSRVNDIARADVLTRASRAEEVEVYLAYQTGLSRRLGLPWQSERMLHGEIAGVGRASVNEAYRTVLSLEAGDGLVNAMLEQPFWETYLEATYNDLLEINDRNFERRLNTLEVRRRNEAMADAGYETLLRELGYERLESRRELTRTLLKKHDPQSDGGSSAP